VRAENSPGGLANQVANRKTCPDFCRQGPSLGRFFNVLDQRPFVVYGRRSANLTFTERLVGRFFNVLNQRRVVVSDRRWTNLELAELLVGRLVIDIKQRPFGFHDRQRVDRPPSTGLNVARGIFFLDQIFLFFKSLSSTHSVLKDCLPASSSLGMRSASSSERLESTPAPDSERSKGDFGPQL
jgi:hypothetical protein